MLNTLMSRDKNMVFEIEEAFELKEYNSQLLDTSSIPKNRSDINAIKRTMEVNQLKIDAEKSKFLPEFGVKYDHMFAFGQQPQQFSPNGHDDYPHALVNKK